MLGCKDLLIDFGIPINNKLNNKYTYNDNNFPQIKHLRPENSSQKTLPENESYLALKST